jgi:putative aldouronate transport system substrate-binding protein
MLRDHNVEVTYQPVGRWSEVQDINNLLAAGDAPDVCVTYDYPTIQNYANMGAVHDVSPYVDGPDGKDLFPNMWGFLGETNLHWDKNVETGAIYGIEAKLFFMGRINTFAREDWLAKLNITPPTTRQQFETMLYAFRDNAELLLGADASLMIPFSTSTDVGWRAAHLIESLIPEGISDKDYYVNGFDDRKLLMPGTKEALRILNKWYNDGLMFNDFALYREDGTVEENNIKAGYVGSFTHNWDYPYRNGDDGIHGNLKNLVGPDAAFITIEPFENNSGIHRKFLAGPVDRKVFLPISNGEPVASLLYLDWLCTLENRKFLQIGLEGITHEVEADGAIRVIGATGEYIINSQYNIDYTIIINGFDMGDESLTARSQALSYAGVDARYIELARGITIKDGRYGKNVQVPEITSEEGMGPVMSDKRDTLLDNAVVASTANFDKVFDDGLADYLSSGGQDIINERLQKWEATYGNATALP